MEDVESASGSDGSLFYHCVSLEFFVNYIAKKCVSKSNIRQGLNITKVGRRSHVVG
jgi:hypothetical protein